MSQTAPKKQHLSSRLGTDRNAGVRDLRLLKSNNEGFTTEYDPLIFELRGCQHRNGLCKMEVTTKVHLASLTMNELGSSSPERGISRKALETEDRLTPFGAGH